MNELDQAMEEEMAKRKRVGKWERVIYTRLIPRAASAGASGATLIPRAGWYRRAVTLYGAIASGTG